MTTLKDRELEQELERERKEMAEALNQTLEVTIRQSWRINAVAWLGVALGAFVLNLLILMLVTGG